MCKVGARSAVVLAIAATVATGCTQASATVTQTQPKALFLVLHGVGGSGRQIADAWGVSAMTGAEILTPTGSVNVEQRPSWNASTACCNDSPDPPDDATMLANMVQAKITSGEVDPNSVFVAGDSNGGFMTWRLICTHAELFTAAAIVSGGANTAADPACQPSRHIPILAVHGTEDPVIMYAVPHLVMDQSTDPALPPLGPGGSFAQEAAFNGCTGQPRLTQGFAFDHDVGLYGTAHLNNYGAETDVIDVDGCPADGPVEIWRMNGSPHDITWSASWPTDLLGWLRAHHRDP